MTASATESGLRMTKRWLRAQSLCGLGVAALAFVVAGQVAAYSALFGSLAVYLPTLGFALIVARNFGKDSGSFLGAAVLGELFKWLFCGAICIAVFVWVDPLAAGWFFTGMCLALLAGWLGLILSS
ncbi:MAG: ATP synthase subunit I [Pseudomonadota bacterium]